MSILQQFNYQGTPVRTVINDGEPWFVAADVARILGYRDAYNLTRRLDTDERGTRSVSTPSGEQEMTVISEPGLFAAVLGSQIDEAKAFKRWVTHEVLPAIRTTGTYGLPRSLPEALRAYAAEVEAHHAAQKRIAVLEPKAHTWETLASAAGDLSVRDAAQVLCRDHRIGIGQNRLFTYLREAHRPWLDRNSRPYQWAVDASLVAEKLQHFTIQRTQGAVLAPPQVRLTAKGLERLRTELTKKPTHQTPAAAHSAGTLTQV